MFENGGVCSSVFDVIRWYRGNRSVIGVRIT